MSETTYLEDATALRYLDCRTRIRALKVLGFKVRATGAFVCYESCCPLGPYKSPKQDIAVEMQAGIYAATFFHIALPPGSTLGNAVCWAGHAALLFSRGSVYLGMSTTGTHEQRVWALLPTQPHPAQHDLVLRARCISSLSQVMLSRSAPDSYPGAALGSGKHT